MTLFQCLCFGSFVSFSVLQLTSWTETWLMEMLWKFSNSDGKYEKFSPCQKLKVMHLNPTVKIRHVLSKDP